MAFRRFSRSRSRFRRSPMRRGRGLRPSKALQRWQAADFFVSSAVAHPAGSGTMQIQMFQLAAQSQLITATTNTDIAFQSTVHSVQIGGLVYDWGVEFVGGAGDGGGGDTTDLDDMAAWYNVGLCYDRMFFDTLGGAFFPAAISSWEPFASDFPINIASLSSAQLEAQRPTRVLHNKSFFRDFGAPIIVNQGESTLHVPQYQHLAPRFGTFNRRLRLRLDQDHGLFFYVATLNTGGFSVDAAARDRVIWFRGTLYYRIET